MEMIEALNYAALVYYGNVVGITWVVLVGFYALLSAWVSKD